MSTVLPQKKPGILVGTLVFTIIFGMSYLFFVPKYIATLHEEIQYPLNPVYFDLDGDGVEEKIEYYGYQLSKQYLRTTIIVKDREDAILGIWNHQGRFIDNSQPFICDHNNDGKYEIYTFHRRQDSIFLNGIDPTKSDEFIFKSRFIDKVPLLNNTVHFQIININTTDRTGDGFADLTFFINAGFSLQPRNTYHYDISKDKLHKSPPSFSRTTFPNAIDADLDGDHKNEIILSTHASDNLRDLSKPFHDKSAYIMVLNNDLKFRFPPYEIKGPLATCRTYPVQINKKTNILAYYHNLKDKGKDSLFLFSANGKLKAARSLDSLVKQTKSTIQQRFFLKAGQKKVLDEPMIYFRNGDIVQFDSTLAIKNKINIGISPVFYIIPNLKIEAAKKPGYLIFTNKKLYFTNRKYQHLASIDIADYKGLRGVQKISRTQNQTPLFFIDGGQKDYKIALDKNKWFENAWVIILAFGILVFVILYLLHLLVNLIRDYNMTRILAERESHKTRLARELHDELGSRITGLRFKIQSLQKTENKHDLEEFSKHLQQTHDELRNIIYNLAPPNFAGQPFYSIVKQLADNFESYSAVKFRTESIPDKSFLDNLDKFVLNELYRIIQEAMNNIAKHAKATKALVQFIAQDGTIELVITDNGAGFDVEKTTKGNNGQGLLSIETRTKILKGKFQINSKPGNGTEIAIQLPINHKKNGKQAFFSFINRRS